MYLLGTHWAYCLPWGCELLIVWRPFHWRQLFHSPSAGALQLAETVGKSQAIFLAKACAHRLKPKKMPSAYTQHQNSVQCGFSEPQLTPCWAAAQVACRWLRKNEDIWRACVPDPSQCFPQHLGGVQLEDCPTDFPLDFPIHWKVAPTKQLAGGLELFFPYILRDYLVPAKLEPPHRRSMDLAPKAWEVCGSCPKTSKS